MTSPFKGLANFLGRLGFWEKKFFASDALAEFSPEHQAAIVKQYLESMGVKGDLPDTDGFDKYAGARLTNVEGFSKVKVGNGSLASKLREASTDPTPAKAQVAREVIAALEKSLGYDPTTGTAQKKFNDDMEGVKKILEDENSPHSAKDVINFIFEQVRDPAHKAIVQQQEGEIAKVKANFSDSTFQTQLKSSLNIDDARVKTMEQEMLHELAAKHKEELEAFEKSINEPLNKLLTVKTPAEYARLALLANQDEHWRSLTDVLTRSDVKKDIKRLNKAALTAQQGSHGQMAATAPQLKLKGVKVEDLKKLKSMTGQTITNNNGTFSIELPDRFLLWSPLYYSKASNAAKNDIMSIVQAVQACGYDSIDLSVDHADKEVAKEYARYAYEASIEAGFDESKIVINVNGTEMKPQELFAGHSESLNASKSMAARYKEQWKEQEKTTLGSSREGIAAIRQDIDAGRAAAAAAVPGAAPPAAAAGRGGVP